MRLRGRIKEVGKMEEILVAGLYLGLIVNIASGASCYKALASFQERSVLRNCNKRVVCELVLAIVESGQRKSATCAAWSRDHIRSI